MSGKPSQFSNWPESLSVDYGPYRAVIDRVVDGDTVYAFISLGMDQYTYESIRIMGIDAPELYRGDEAERAKGKAAKEYLESIAPPGTKCHLCTDRDRQSFGRYSGTLVLADSTHLAVAMVAAGHAKYSDW